jgi:hypothetical protein
LANMVMENVRSTSLIGCLKPSLMRLNQSRSISAIEQGDPLRPVGVSSSHPHDAAAVTSRSARPGSAAPRSLVGFLDFSPL